MLKGGQVVTVMLLVATSMALAGNAEQDKSGFVATCIALDDAGEQVGPSTAIRRDRKQAQQAPEQAYREHLPTVLQLRDCAERDAMLTTQQEELDAEEAALRAEEARLAARKRAIQAMLSNGSTERLAQAEGELSEASAQLKKKIDNFARLSEPYGAGVLYQVQHCAFSQVRRQDLQQLCQEGTYSRFCAKYQTFQTDE
ncbi:hypothetical protein [Noviherbaspirillum autotrophicum]|uniref:Uncharacterized protein n=1 Tax=Noviherbaspirillum autotrophicum TaxID=709839 RepID=A0A0C2BSD9_9BURK|nr:hypothetical protein [Noviherbaspirillum autotrophicum]KIF81684.1 hypothetical protein TSA66_14235 [Noviherbaspirillum autotrophicum]KIF82051.1 hypothetical protein TSA66_16600 [Noviherbaspirillum autotrophicum]KIF84155.1 hypothetical protein TSA66_00420 [Noviherbaspirillum autotrophicum]